MQAFSLAMEATINGKSFQGRLRCESYESLSLVFTAPDELAGFTAETEDGGYRINLHGRLTDSLPRELLPRDSPLRLLFDAVRTAVFTNHGAFVRDKEADRYSAQLTVGRIPVAVS